jgi:hypothetical protein
MGGVGDSRARTSPEILDIFPNPSSGVFTVAFGSPSTGRIEIVLYDLTGRMVATIANGIFHRGNHNVSVDCPNVPAGVYFARLIRDQEHVLMRPIIVLEP